MLENPDITEIVVRGGDGGNGAISFRREKFVPFGGPDGGDGGVGGKVLLVADYHTRSLQHLRADRPYTAGRGQDGSGRKKHGRRGNDLELNVPIGTEVWEVLENEDRRKIADLIEDGQKVVVAEGGIGGIGNVHFATAIYRVPRIATRGEPGEERRIFLKYKLLVDVAIIGKPNSGKSSLLAAMTKARPFVGEYPFTTTEPVLGVVEMDTETFSVAELPAITKGASQGAGLGIGFFQHAERARVIILVVDGASEDPGEDVEELIDEMAAFNPALLEKQRIVAVNKIDLPDAKAKIPSVELSLKIDRKNICFVSAVTGEGIEQLKERTWQLLQSARPEVIVLGEAEVKIFRPQPREEKLIIRREDTIFVLEGRQIEGFKKLYDLGGHEADNYIRIELQRLGVSKALERVGAQKGDKIRIGTREFVFQ